MKDSAKINELLRQEPEFDMILAAHNQYHDLQKAIDMNKEAMKSYQDNIRDLQEAQEVKKEVIKSLLLALEDKTGFSKAPDVAHLSTTPVTYEVDIDACPEDYIRIKREVDMPKVKKAIQSGELLLGNWIKANEVKRAVVIK